MSVVVVTLANTKWISSNLKAYCVSLKMHFFTNSSHEWKNATSYFKRGLMLSLLYFAGHVTNIAVPILLFISKCIIKIVLPSESAECADFLNILHAFHSVATQHMHASLACAEGHLMQSWEVGVVAFCGCTLSKVSSQFATNSHQL